MKSFTSSGSFDAFISVLPMSNGSIKEERISQRSANIRGMSNNTFMAYWIIHAGWLNVYMCICSSFRNCSVLLGLALPCRSFSITSRRLESTSHFDAHRVQLSVTLETEKSSLISNINTYGRGKDESCLHFAAQSTRNVLTAARNVLFFCCIFISTAYGN
jgi:hypothetical protein